MQTHVHCVFRHLCSVWFEYNIISYHQHPLLDQRVDIDTLYERCRGVSRDPTLFKYHEVHAKFFFYEKPTCARRDRLSLATKTMVWDNSTEKKHMLPVIAWNSPHVASPQFQGWVMYVWLNSLFGLISKYISGQLRREHGVLHGREPIWKYRYMPVCGRSIKVENMTDSRFQALENSVMQSASAFGCLRFSLKRIMEGWERSSYGVILNRSFGYSQVEKKTGEKQSIAPSEWQDPWIGFSEADALCWTR